VSFRPGRTIAALAVAVFMITVFAGSASAVGSGTFSGTITPTDCGPMHDIPVVAGDTTIDAVAAEYVSANDITVDLYNPSGQLVEHVDTLTSPESLHYATDKMTAGIYHLQVCPFPGGVVTAPYDYTGSYSVTNGPPEDVPGSLPGTEVGPPTITRTTGKLRLSPATVVDAQRTEGEPLDWFDQDGNLWESGPWGTTTQNSFIHRSTDGGLEFHVDSPNGLRPDPGPGGGDTDVVTDDQGNVYFVDLEALVNLGTSVSNDSGNNWRKNPAAVRNTAVDRQWYAVDNGPTAAASDNTVFLAFHETQIGTYIYSSPGSTGPTDPVGGLVWQDSSTNAPLPLANDATCAQLRFDPVYRNLYYACNEGNHVRVTIGHVAPGQRTGIEYHNVALPVSPGGGGPGHLFPALAVDQGGNVYAAWIDTRDNNVYYSSSTDQGQSWTSPVQVNSAPSVTNEFLWAQGGAAGTLALAWYGTDTAGQPDSFPNWATNPQGATSVPWWGYLGVISKATTPSATIAQQRFTEKPMHYGQICNQGIGCSVSQGDRQMADYFGFNVDKSGSMRIVYNDTTNQHNGAGLYEIRQVGGSTIFGGSSKGLVVKDPAADPTGDAQWPHYSPTGAGPNQPQFDFTGVQVGQPSAGVVRVRMSLSSLKSLQPPTGKTSSVWLTRFQALSTGDSGEEAYRIFYVGAESIGGLTPSFFAGSTTCTNTTPGNCKVLNYPAQQQVTGHVCGNTLVADVPLSGFGNPVTGALLYNVTAVSGGRNSADDLYADIDATRSFDYVFGSNKGGSSC
jgi:type 1 fimbria pilin